MIVNPGDVLVSKGEHANFQVQFSDEGRWWPCHLDFENSYLVVNSYYSDEWETQFAKLLPLGCDFVQTWWFEGSLADWCTLDKLS